LWPSFVEKSLSDGGGDGMLLKPEGCLLFVHPALWRKPSSTKALTLFDVMVHRNHMIYLEIHSKPDGKRDFKADTRYDFYLIQKRRPIPRRDLTHVKDQIGEEHDNIDLSEWQFLPNHSFELIKPLLTTTEQDYVIFSRNQFGSDQSWVKSTKHDEYIHPLVHSTPMKGHRIYWSSTTTPKVKELKPMFGVPKVIFGESGINNAICDIRGEFGMTQGAIGLKIPDPIEREGPAMKKALESERFHTILDAMSFSNFRIDWRMFLFISPDFYRHEMFQGQRRAVAVATVDDADDVDLDDADKVDDSKRTFVKVGPAREEPSKSRKKGGRTSRRKTTYKRRKYKQLRHTRKKY
jgi:hypothetical protein